jgi:hypothetical protein
MKLKQVDKAEYDLLRSVFAAVCAVDAQPTRENLRKLKDAYESADVHGKANRKGGPDVNMIPDKHPIKMTEQELRNAHRALWNELSKHPRWRLYPVDRKVRALRKLNVSDKNFPCNFCYACELNLMHMKHGDPLCGACPCKWPDGLICDDTDSLYQKWSDSTSEEEMAAYAMAIRDAWE